MPTATLRVVCAAEGRGAAKTAFPRGPWERGKPRVRPDVLFDLDNAGDLYPRNTLVYAIPLSYNLPIGFPCFLEPGGEHEFSGEGQDRQRRDRGDPEGEHAGREGEGDPDAEAVRRAADGRGEGPEEGARRAPLSGQSPAGRLGQEGRPEEGEGAGRQGEVSAASDVRVP